MLKYFSCTWEKKNDKGFILRFEIQFGFPLFLISPPQNHFFTYICHSFPYPTTCSLNHDKVSPLFTPSKPTLSHLMTNIMFRPPLTIWNLPFGVGGYEMGGIKDRTHINVFLSHAFTPPFLKPLTTYGPLRKWFSPPHETISLSITLLPIPFLHLIYPLFLPITSTPSKSMYYVI